MARACAGQCFCCPVVRRESVSGAVRVYTARPVKEHCQIELQLDGNGIDSRELVRFLNDGARYPARVVFTRNRVSMITVRFAGDGSADVRLHRGFLDAPPEVHKALRSYLRSRRRGAWLIVSAYARGIGAHTRVGRGDSHLPANGKVHDLNRIAREVNRRFFNDRIKCHVGWGRRYRGRRSRRGRTIRYGSWDESTRTVRVNPILDDRCVPEEFVRYIVFHEMLHAIVPHETENGCRRHHTRQFRALEKTFPRLGRMKTLCDELLVTLP